MRIAVAGLMAAGGDALARLDDGRVVFVEGALPGETVTVELVEDRKDFARARVTHVEVPSPDRADPPCPHVARGCGGCPWQHVDPGAQTRLKEGIVADALRRIGHISTDLPWLPAATIGDRAYRTTAHLAVDGAGRPAYRRRHSRDLVAVDSCLVAHPRLAELIETVRAPGAKEVSLRIGVAGGERLVVPKPPVAGVDAPADATVVGLSGKHGPGSKAALHEDVDGRRWRVSAHSFFQSGPAAAAALVEAVDAAVGDALAGGDLLVDAYAGVGLLGGVVAARRRSRLVSVESHRGAAADARSNLADLDAKVEEVEVGRWTAQPAQVVIADPARSGLGRPGVAALVAARARRLVLVSCDPASLGRDCALLAAAGYKLASLQVVDLFPHTVHVETVAGFDRA